MSEELQSQELVIINEQISQELVKQNVTQAVIGELRERYAGLKISGIEDKETYLIVKEGRKKCKEVRVMAKKICEKGREKAVAEQKAWVKAQKDVTEEILGIEDPLEEQEKAYEAAVAKDKADRQRRQEEQLIMRQQVLTNMGALYSDGSFHLGEVSFELSVVKESEPDIWEESILPKFKEEYEKVEAERIEQERIKKEQEIEFQRKELEQEKKRLELEEKEKRQREKDAELKAKEDELLAKKQAELKAAREAKEKSRCDQLMNIGLRLGMEDGHTYFMGYDSWVSHLDITGYNDEKWDDMIIKLTAHVANRKEEEEQKRLAEIEEQKEKQRVIDLRRFRCDTLIQYGVVDYHEDIALYSDEQWANLLVNVKLEYEKIQKEKWEKEQEEKRKAEELKKQLELEQAKDKEKWEEIIRRVNEIEVYEMRSSQYRKKAMILREKLEEIKSL